MWLYFVIAVLTSLYVVLYSVHCTLYSVHCTVRILCIAQYVLYIYAVI